MNWKKVCAYMFVVFIFLVVMSCAKKAEETTAEETEETAEGTTTAAPKTPNSEVVDELTTDFEEITW